MHKEIKLTPIMESIQFIEMNDKEYFSPKWSGYISNSKLKDINPEQGGSPEKFFAPMEPLMSDSLVFGSAVHEMVLQPESFAICYTVDRPTAKAGLMADELYPIYIHNGNSVSDASIIKASDKVNYYKGKMNEKKISDLNDKILPYFRSRVDFEEANAESTKEFIYLDPKSREKLQSCIFNVSNSKEIQDLLHPEGVIETPLSMNEAALFMDVKATLGDKEVILKLKGKLDNFTWDSETNELVLNDLKTTGHLLDMFKESFATYHYARQMAFYLYMLRLWIEKEKQVKPSNMKANMLLVSTVPDYQVGVYKVNTKQMKQGFDEFRDLLQRVAYCMMNGYDGSMGTKL